MKSLRYHSIWLLLLLLIMACSGHNDRSDINLKETGDKVQNAVKQPVITFDTLSHDFGTIIEGEKVVCYFDYENTGTADLLIQSVEATCGCTTPDWSSEPLKPGQRKSLSVIFDATGRSGSQRKVVTVISNSSNEVVRLTLKAYIET